MAKAITDPNTLVRDEIAKLPNFRVGVRYEEFKKNNPELDLIRLGSNENPYGPSPQVLDAITSNLDKIHLYPDNTCSDLAREFASLLNVKVSQLVFDCGAESIMLSLTNVCLRPGDKVLCLSPTFPVLNIWAAAAGATVIGIPHEDDLSFSAERFCLSIDQSIRMIYLCMPNNPTGSYFSKSELSLIIESVDPNTLFVLDEAYVEFSGNKLDYPDAIALLTEAGKPFISLRTMSKAYALAGMRVGYGICYHEDFAALLKRSNTVFNVGVLTLKAAVAALSDKVHLDNYLEAIYSERRRLEDEIARMGLRAFESGGNFICLSLPSFEKALKIEQDMQQTGIFIKGQRGRSIASSDFEGVLRITIGKPAENNQMLKILKTLV